MKYHKYTEKELLVKSQDMVHAYFNRDMDTFIDTLDDDFVWIGSYDFHYTRGKDEFIKASKQESEEVSAQISDEEYSLLCHERNIWIVYGRFTAYAWKDEETLLYTRQRLTLVWRQKEDDLKLIHINCTMARDIPLETDPARIDEKLKENIRWYDYIRQFEEVKEQEERIMLKDVTGGIHYLYPVEILSIHIENRLSTIHTGNDSIVVRRNLNQLLDDIPQLLQVHKNWLINPAHVRQIQRYTVTLSQDMQIPIGKSRYNEVKEALTRK